MQKPRSGGVSVFIKRPKTPVVYQFKTGAMNECVKRHHLVMGILCVLTVPLLADLPEAFPTFHSIGLYWKTENGSATDRCDVYYRIRGRALWNAAQPLWFDDNVHSGAAARNDEYRGSIVNLLPGTTYEIRLNLAESGTEETLIVSTWSEDFKIKSVVTIPEGVHNEPLEIDSSGSASEGYVLYTAPEGKSAIIDVKDNSNWCIRITASYVIVRDLVLRGASEHGIYLLNVNDVIIESCDISGWGIVENDGFGANFSSAIYSVSNRLERIVIQRCRLHHPRSDANSWLEGGHPEGPQGITFVNSRGGHVIRYNEIYSDADHYFNDGMGEYHNFSYGGFPNRDSDIYCNKISHCWDDGIEAEGACMNVRMWSNFIDSTYMAFGLATTSLGPHYLFRNVSNFSQRAPYPLDKYSRNGSLFKLGTSDVEYTRGRMVILHNTIHQPPSPWGISNIKWNGCEGGLTWTNSEYHQSNVLSRNNILHVNNYARDKLSIADHLEDISNSFDYDLFNGAIEAADGNETHGIVLEWDKGPLYDEFNDASEFYLEPHSIGTDAGEAIPNFNDYYEGTAPDIGAYETGFPPLPFGVDADWTEWLNDSPVTIKRAQSAIPPRDFYLSVFPNPFNRSTNILYKLYSPNRVEVTIFNIRGETVDSFTTGHKKAGIHTVRWDAGDMASGHYFVRVNAGPFNRTVKCILLK